MFAAACTSAGSRASQPVITSGRFAFIKALAAATTNSSPSAPSMAAAMAKPVAAKSAGAPCRVAVASSSMRVEATEAMNSGLFAAWAWPRTPASCHCGMPAPSAMSKVTARTAWRTASAIRAAVLGTSSPRISTASACSMSVSEGMSKPPARYAANAASRTAASSSAMPGQKFSAPTSCLSAKFASKEARGEPMPTTPPSPRSRAATASSAAARPRASNTPSSLRTPALRMRFSLFTKCEP